MTFEIFSREYQRNVYVSKNSIYIAVKCILLRYPNTKTVNVWVCSGKNGYNDCIATMIPLKNFISLQKIMEQM